MANLQLGQRWRVLREGWQEVDWLLLLLPFLLTLFASVVLVGIQHRLGHTRYDLNHLGLGFISLLLALWIARNRYERLQSWAWIIYLITNLSLILVMLIGTVGNGAQSWIGVGGFYVQPSEFAKVGVIITLAAILSRRDASTLPGLITALGVMAIPWLLVFFQPDLGSSLVFGAITLTMLY